MTDIDKMQLPEVNQRRQLSTVRQNELKLELVKTIIKFQNDKNYLFESFEADNVLLQMIQENHESYLSSRFGHKTV